MSYFKSLLMLVAVTLGSVSFVAVAEDEVNASSQKAETPHQAGVNINTADSETLAIVLKGVGEKRAQAIVNYRDTNGPFTDVNQLQQIKGISAGIIKKNLDKIRL